MEIERLWGREPGWFASRDREEQVRLLAWQRIYYSPIKGSTSRKGGLDPRVAQVTSSAAADFWGVG